MPTLHQVYYGMSYRLYSPKEDINALGHVCALQSTCSLLVSMNFVM
ncbi:hypothetical protein BVRB_3g058630 [Beta vulgaris subsp. vulgaris]|nr:hypothetical protein BVRB_3g058630 [Beta vulgaris subsp. vulgaris]